MCIYTSFNTCPTLSTKPILGTNPILNCNTTLSSQLSYCRHSHSFPFPIKSTPLSLLFSCNHSYHYPFETHFFSITIFTLSTLESPFSPPQHLSHPNCQFHNRLLTYLHHYRHNSSSSLTLYTHLRHILYCRTGPQARKSRRSAQYKTLNARMHRHKSAPSLLQGR